MKKLVLLGATLVVAVVAFIGALVVRADATSSTDYTLCQQVELVKKSLRIDAWKSWRDLDKTLRILHIQKTDEIVATARASRDRRLRLFHKIDCEALPTQ